MRGKVNSTVETKGQATPIPPTTAAAATRSAPQQALQSPNIEAIRMRAYEKYCSRHGGPGDELSDWLSAERELLANGQPATPGKVIRPGGR